MTIATFDDGVRKDGDAATGKALSKNDLSN